MCKVIVLGGKTETRSKVILAKGTGCKNMVIQVSKFFSVIPSLWPKRCLSSFIYTGEVLIAKYMCWGWGRGEVCECDGRKGKGHGGRSWSLHFMPEP